MSHQLINQDSGVDEYYTQEYIIDLVYRVLGHIDLDPASCMEANEVVKAKHIFTKETDGLTQVWFGNVWMNHPFHKGEKACAKKCKKVNCKKSRKKGVKRRGHCITEDIPSNEMWINKLVNEYESGHVKEAICITFSSMSEAWMTPLLGYLQCFPQGRIYYRKPDGTVEKQATKGSMFTYMGNNEDKFAEVFSEIGTIKKEYIPRKNIA